MVTLQIATSSDIESLAQLFEELVVEQTELCKMKENSTKFWEL
ncbi:hypothetical protein [Desulfosporosinus fructosivorans]|nr:hypothetical protein [Desulfosporosinus fructosivorans]